MGSWLFQRFCSVDMRHESGCSPCWLGWGGQGTGAGQLEKPLNTTRRKPRGHVGSVGFSFSRVSVLQGGGHAKAEAQREGHASAGRRVAWGTSPSGFAEGSRRPAGSGTDQEGLSLRALGETTAGDALL